LAINLIGLSTSYLEDQAIRGVYYDANWNMSDAFPIITQAGLFWRHLVSWGGTTSAPSDLGFDRWFVPAQSRG